MVSALYCAKLHASFCTFHLATLLILINICSIVSLNRFKGGGEGHQYGGWGSRWKCYGAGRSQPPVCCASVYRCTGPIGLHQPGHTSSSAQNILYSCCSYKANPPSPPPVTFYLTRPKNVFLYHEISHLTLQVSSILNQLQKVAACFLYNHAWEFWNEAGEDVECWQKGQPQNGQFLYLCVQGSKS